MSILGKVGNVIEFPARSKDMKNLLGKRGEVCSWENKD